MTTEQYQIGYEDGYSAGFDAGIEPQPNTQEPVAYLMQPAELSHQSLMKSLHFNKAHDRSDWEVIPLYTHPAPQAKPLTTEEVEQILAQHNYELHGDRARYIVRMTEQAHNIGVKP